MTFLGVITNNQSEVHAKGQGQIHDAQTWNNIEEAPYCFSRPYVKFQGHTGQKNHPFGPELGVSGLQLKFEFTDGFEMMHKA